MNTNVTTGPCSRCGSTTRGGKARSKLRDRRVRERSRILERLANLSEREREVLMLIARGVSPAMIADRLGINVKTVSTYRARTLEKLCADSNTELALAVYKAGLLE